MASCAGHQLSIQSVATKGTELVTYITRYLSSIPTPVYILEDLVGIVGVTNSLLSSLDAALTRCQNPFEERPSFVHPLCQDVSAAFEELSRKADEAIERKVFEPNDSDLVRAPRFAWFEIMGNEKKAVALRSSLAVEKYRVRVLIDAVNYKRLKDLDVKLPKRPEQIQEHLTLAKMLPVLAERLTKLHDDYLPRISQAGTFRDDTATIVAEESAELLKVQEDLKLEQGITKSSTFSSTNSSASVADDSIEEAWLLRRNESEKTLKQTHHFFGLLYKKSYDHKAATYYVKPIRSSASEIINMKQSAQGEMTEAEYQEHFKKMILNLDQDAQWEIQKLVESRDAASSTDTVRRNWEVVAFQPRPRRKISASLGSKKWLKKGKDPLVEWMLVLKGQTMDHASRVTPVKHSDPWQSSKTEKKSSTKSTSSSQNKGDVLVHVEKKAFMSQAEAEQRMKCLLSTLFRPETNLGNFEDVSK